MRTQLFGICLIAGLLASVSSAPLLGQMKEKSLYDRLGKKKAIAAVVDEFVARAAADSRINKFFAATAADPARLKKFKGNLVDQICEASGGPCKYTGAGMVDAHRGMNISDAEFTALVEDLIKSLDKFKVPDKEKSDVLGAVSGLKADIVGR